MSDTFRLKESVIVSPTMSNAVPFTIKRDTGDDAEIYRRERYFSYTVVFWFED
jgi:hypothetical protein